MVEGYQRNQITLSTRISDLIGKLWLKLVTSPDDAAQEAFAQAAARVVEPSQVRVIQMADAFVRQYETMITGASTVEPVDVSAIMSGLRNGAPTVEVYSRPSVTARTALSQGKPWSEALQMGLHRATATADTDMQLASRAGQFDAMRRSTKTVGYRRVPDGKACAFCLLASTQRYTLKDLMPLHVHCHCSVLPILESKDPGRVVDKRLLNQVKDGGVTVYKKNAAGERTKYTYNHEDIAVREHGELGPVLTLKSDNFTGPKDI